MNLRKFFWSFECQEMFKRYDVKGFALFNGCIAFELDDCNKFYEPDFLKRYNLQLEFADGNWINIVNK